LSRLLGLLEGAEIGAPAAVSAGEACFQLGQPERARGFFAQALRREPGHAEALNNLGVIAFQEGRFTEAEAYFLQALTATEQPEARTNLALMYRAVPETTMPRPGAVFFCPCCGGHFPAFIPGGPRLRPRACCPCCGALERHRLAWLYLKEKTDFFSARLRVLHVAPERVFRDAFRSLPNLDYVSADLCSPMAMLRMDLAAIPCRDHSFDVILCSHVLEHVPDDRLGMGEMARVLRPGGWALVQAPVDKRREATFEDPAVTDPTERERLFGQHDHVRWYGRDFPQRLGEAGFEVSIEPFLGSLSAEEVARYGLGTGEDLYLCRKAPRVEAPAVAQAPVPKEETRPDRTAVRHARGVMQPEAGPEPEDPLVPILVRGAGRSGSTALMEALSLDERIVFPRSYPFESRYLTYWFRLSRLVGAGRDNGPEWNELSVADPGLRRVGPIPFKDDLGLDRAELVRRLFVGAWGTFGGEIRRTRSRLGQPEPLYYAEKTPGDVVMAVKSWGVPVKELLLLRDPRDVFLSSLQFNRKRGRLGFGQEEGQGPAEFARLLCGRMRPLLAVFALARPGPSLLAIRYEDLILDRPATLGRIFGWLGLPVPQEESGRVGAFLERHSTSGSPAESVGRWRRELDPELRDLFLSELGSLLEAAGYDAA
jgi:SAM-dependent methyltransferase